MDGEMADKPVLTHHLLLILSEWRHEYLGGIEDRAVNWFVSNLKDETLPHDFEPFKLFAFTFLNRPDLKDYVSQKTAILRNQRTADGYTVLELGFRDTRDSHAVFPTLVAAQILIREGSPESIKMAARCLEWSKKQMDADTVYANVQSINGFAALLAAEYCATTGDTRFENWAFTLLKLVTDAQANGLWMHTDKEGKVVESKYQSAYLFYDLSILHNLLSSVDTEKSLLNMLRRVDANFFQADSLQSFVLICSCLLRAFAHLLSKQQKDSIIRKVMDISLIQSNEYARISRHLAAAKEQYDNYLKDVRDQNCVLINPELFKLRDFEINRKQIFVLIPFNTQHNIDFEQTYSLIEKSVTKLEFKCTRAISQFQPNAFVEEIWKGINESRLLIADLTHCNPNVLYEVGIAHTVGKKVILLTQGDEHVPANMKHLTYLKYNQENHDGFINDLTKAINDSLIQV